MAPLNDGALDSAAPAVAFGDRTQGLSPQVSGAIPPHSASGTTNANGLVSSNHLHGSGLAQPATLNATPSSQVPMRPLSRQSGTAGQPTVTAVAGNSSSPASDTSSTPSTTSKSPFAFIKNLRTSAAEKEKNAGPYTVSFPASEADYHKKSNYIRTTKYTLASFFPKTLFYQFRRFYNLYFLAGALSVTAGASSLSPASQILPLIVVLAFSLAKEAYEDYARYKADRKANMKSVTVLRQGKREVITAMLVQPGDIVYLEKGEKAPVDGVILSSNYEDGTCFVETAELDGETNLKRRSALHDLSHFHSDEEVSRLGGTVQCEQPNDKLAVFDGLLTLTQEYGGPQTARHALTPTNIVLRGSNIRNTDFAYLLVIYTGGNTKIIKNLKKPKLKTSTLEKHLNWLVMGAFLYNLVLLISSIALEYRWYKSIRDREVANMAFDPVNYPVHWYIGPVDDQASKHVLLTVVTFFALYTYVIPISLFVTIEIVRVIQAKYIHWDVDMRSYLRHSDGSPLTIKSKANNSNLNEDLGVVEYVFSDKTGTVTRNEMNVVGWYLEDVGKIPAGISEGAGALATMAGDPNQDPGKRERLVKFGHALALCHSVIPAPDPRDPSALLYESQSPDESALLHGIKADGFTLLSRTKATIYITDPANTDSSTPMEFSQLALLDFTSDRKRMSIIVRYPNGGPIVLYCKGADNIIIERLAPGQEHLIKEADDALRHYSEQGLRTLVVAYKTLSEEEFQKFKLELDEAERSLTNREQTIAAVSETIETGLLLLGCTAIEDRLQDQVPETIEFLVNCGIKVWLLTGDKMETAINIGMSSRLILPDMLVLKLTGRSEDELQSQMESFIQDLTPQSPDASLPTHAARPSRSGSRSSGRFVGRPRRRAALIIPGASLHVLFGHSTPHLSALMLELSQLCTTVIACRVTPLQKAQVVQLVQKNLRCTTLAIGDGANDVSMIQAASVGVGVVGREGTQAVRAADYAIGEFRHLAKLLTVHGRWSRLRLSSLVFYSFYKNMTMITVQWVYGFWCAWSGTLVYEEIFLTAFNIIFTSLPPFFLAIFDYDAKPRMLLDNPRLYKDIRKGMYWSMLRTIRTLFEAVVTALCIYFTVYVAFHDNSLDRNGYTAGYWTQTYLFSTPMLLIVLIRAAMMHVVWVGKHASVTLGVLIASLAFNIAVMGVVEGFKWVDRGTFESVHVLPGFWVVTILLVGTCSVGVLVIKYFYHHFRPSDIDILLEDDMVQNRQKKQQSDGRRRGKSGLRNSSRSRPDFHENGATEKIEMVEPGAAV